MEKQKNKGPLGLRVPDDLRQWLKNKAEQNKRSLNSEIWLRLERSRREEEEEFNEAA